MKKIVIIVSVFISFISIFLMALPIILKVTSLDKPVKEYIIPKIIDTSTGTLEVDKFSIGYGTLDFTDVLLNTSNGQLSIHIDAISLNISFWNFLLNPTSEHHAINAVYLINPKVIVHKVISQDKEKASTADYKFIREKLRPLRKVDKIVVKNGMIEWEDNNKSTIIAQNLSGWLTVVDSTDLKIDVLGDIFSYTDNKLQLKVDVDLVNEIINADITIDNYDLSKSLFSMHESYIDGLKSGIIDSKITIRNKNLEFNNALINGYIKVKNLTLVSDKLDIEKLNINTTIVNNKLDISNANCLFFNAPFTFKGKVDDILKPHIKGDMELKEICLEKINNYYDINSSLWDKISLKSTFNIDLYKTFSFNLSSDLEFFYTNSKNKDELSCKVSGDKNYVQVDNIRSTYRGIAFRGMFKYLIGDENIDGYLNLTYNTGKHVLFDNLSDKEQTLNIGIRLNLEKWRFDAKWQYLIDGSNPLLSMEGTIHNTEKDLFVNLTNSNIDNLDGSIIIHNYATKPEIKNATVKNFPFIVFTNNKMFKTFSQKLYTEMDLSGTLNELNGSVFVKEKDNPLNDFLFKTTVKNLFTSNKEFFGSVEIKNLKGSFKTNLNDDNLNAMIDFPEGISGELKIDLTKNEQLSGYLDFENFKILKVLSDSGSTDDFRMQGELNGKMEINGAINNPQYDMFISADKFVINNIGYYQALLKVNGDLNRVYVDSISMSLNNHPFADGSIDYSFSDDRLNGKLYGNNISLDDIFTTFGRESSIISGIANYDISLEGSKKNPKIRLNSEVTDGVIANIEFDKMKLSLSDIISDSALFFNINNHFLNIKELSIEKDGLFSFSTRGKLPFDKRKQLDLSLKFDGDLLHYLPDWVGFFIEGKSNVHLSADIGGNNSRIRINAAKLNISEGELRLKDVAPHIKEISGFIEIKEGSNEINITNFNASVGKQKLLINTVRNVKLQNGEKLKPWYFKDLDLDFGVLTLETSEEGVSVHIPGIMQKKDYGNLYLSGQNEEEKFYFAGPVKNPRLRGSVSLYNTRITYPFLISEDDKKNKPSVAMLFLQKINWDILIKPGENVLYIRDIPAYIDNVHAEVYVDESSPGLYLNGIINKRSIGAIGQLTSSRGELEYLDQNFRVERFAVEFNKFSNDPDVSGRAYTTIRDSIGAVPKMIYLDLFAYDPKTGREEKITTLDNLHFKLVSSEPKLGETQEQVLASLGYSVDNLSEKASNIGGAVADRYLIRPLLRPVERLLEKQLGFDMVRVHSNVAKNLFYNSLGGLSNSPVDGRYYSNPFTTNSSYLHLFQNSEIIVGKYLTQDLYLTYTGRLVSIYNQNVSSFDFNHSIGLEYRFFQNMLLEFQYDRESMGIYNLSRPNYYIQDFKIRLRFQHPISFF